MQTIKLFKAFRKWYPEDICEVILKYREDKIQFGIRYRFQDISKFLVDVENKCPIVMMVNRFIEKSSPYELFESIIIEKNIEGIIKQLANIRHSRVFGIEDVGDTDLLLHDHDRYEVIDVNKKCLYYTLSDDDDDLRTYILIKICNLNTEQITRILNFFKFNVEVDGRTNRSYTRKAYSHLRLCFRK